MYNRKYNQCNIVSSSQVNVIMIEWFSIYLDSLCQFVSICYIENIYILILFLIKNNLYTNNNNLYQCKIIKNDLYLAVNSLIIFLIT